MTETLLTLLGSYVFPIVACCAMGYYVKYKDDKNREDIKELTKQNAENAEKWESAMSDVKEAICNNTVALKILAERMGVKNENT